MPDLTLRSQIAYAREGLDTGDPRRALNVGRRILEAFPRCVAAYALLGEALLRLDSLEQAEDLLLRAWGVCPEMTSACLGLAAIAERRGDRAAARAWRERAGEAPTGGQEAALSRTGLVRLWLRQGLAAHAVRELRALLAEQPERYDLQVTLAEALWRAEAEGEAAELAEEILAAHPQCLKALLIAGKYWLHGRRDAQARRWLQEAQALDPDNATAQELFGAAAPLPPRVVRLPYREEELPPLDLPWDRDADSPSEGAA